MSRVENSMELEERRNLVLVILSIVVAGPIALGFLTDFKVIAGNDQLP